MIVRCEAHDRLDLDFGRRVGEATDEGERRRRIISFRVPRAEPRISRRAKTLHVLPAHEIDTKSQDFPCRCADSGNQRGKRVQRDDRLIVDGGWIRAVVSTSCLTRQPGQGDARGRLGHE